MKAFRITDKWASFAVTCVVGLVCGAASPAWGAGTNVSIVDFAFNPPAVTIKPNDSVTWTWAGSFSHSSTADGTSPLWDSGILPHGSTFSHTFANAGSFPYHCLVHASMTASVTVQGQTNSGGAIVLGSVQITAVGNFRFSYSASAGLNYAVDRSADLVKWTPLATNNASSTQVTFTDTTATAAANFYRVRRVTP